MTRNYVALFISIAIILTALLDGAFGEKGMLVNSRITSKVVSAKHMRDQKELELRTLEDRLERVWEPGELLDEARIMGYVQAGEAVYFFTDGTKETDPTVVKARGFDETTEMHKEKHSWFTFLPRHIIRILALVSAIFITAGVRFVMHRRDRMTMTFKR